MDLLPGEEARVRGGRNDSYCLPDPRNGVGLGAFSEGRVPSPLTKRPLSPHTPRHVYQLRKLHVASRSSRWISDS